MGAGTWGRIGAVAGGWAPVIALMALIASLALAGPVAEARGADSCRKQDEEVLEQADVKAAERSLLCLLNVHRAANGVPPLASDPDLAAAAREHSEDMVTRHFYDHINPDGEDPTDRAKGHGYPGGAGENIYWRPLSNGVSPIQFFLGWEQSASHDQNMLSDVYEAAGMGFALGTPEQGTAGATATQAFGVVDTGATYTGLDMLIPARCPPARKALRSARAALEAARENGQGVRKAKRQLKRKAAAKRRACKPTGF